MTEEQISQKAKRHKKHC